MSRLLAAILVLLITSSEALTQSRSDFRAVLIPVYDSGPGAFGAVWISDFRIYNDSEQEAQFANYVYVAPCNLAAPCPAHVPPKTVVTFGFWPNQTAGVLIYEPKALGSSLHYHLRVRDQARQDPTSGTEMPVVYENEFRNDEFFLLDVPTSRDVRQTLRLYALDVDALDVRVRFFTQPQPTFDEFRPRPQVLRETIVRLARPPVPDYPVFPFRPTFAWIQDLSAHFPEIGTQEKIMIGVASLNPGIPIWAFVSVTSNSTQQVTTITPQPSRAD